MNELTELKRLHKPKTLALGLFLNRLFKIKSKIMPDTLEALERKVYVADVGLFNAKLDLYIYKREIDGNDEELKSLLKKGARQ